MTQWSPKRWKKLQIIGVVGLLTTIFIIPPVLLWNIYGFAGASFANGEVTARQDTELRLFGVLVHINYVLIFVFALGVVVSLVGSKRAAK